jgi:hypothetical protein
MSRSTVEPASPFNAAGRTIRAIGRSYPDALRRFPKHEMAQVCRRNHTFLNHEVEVDRLTPVRLSGEDDRQLPDLFDLQQREYLEKLVARAEASGEEYGCLRSLKQMKLADRPRNA